MSYEKKQDNLPLVVIFGRTNVGKSTLFNCLIEKKMALVSRVSGTTRDSNIGRVDWRNAAIRLVDTGGIDDLKILSAGRRERKNQHRIKEIDSKVQLQAREYLLRADLILFLVDTRDGLLPQDKAMALGLKKILSAADRQNRSATAKIILVANKADNPKLRKETAEFNRLGLGEPLPGPAANGSGTGDLLDVITGRIGPAEPASADEKEEEGGDDNNSDDEGKNGAINVSIIGKPNVGKSSLINSLVGEERIIVSSIPHTTREPQNIAFACNGQEINLIDTAGISKKGQRLARRPKIKTLEKFSIVKSLSVLKKSDIALLVIVINVDITRQEARLVEEIINTKTSLIIIANKWDTVEEKNTKLYTEKIYDSLPFVTWAPIQFVSALTGEKVNKIPELILRVAKERGQRISDSILAKLLARIVKKHLPAKAKGTKHPHIYELKQTNENPPKFSIRIGSKDTIHFSYLHFIENRLREKFGFLGTPLTIWIEKNRRVHGTHNS